MHNILKYVIRQKIYRQLHITLFYILAVATVILRLGYIFSVIAKPKIYAPFDSYIIGGLFSMLQY